MFSLSNNVAPTHFGVSQRSWRLTPKQDHLVCFLGGNLMLGAVTTGAHNGSVSVPPRMSELTEQGQRDWNTGVALVQTCMDTHDTATLGPIHVLNEYIR